MKKLIIVLISILLLILDNSVMPFLAIHSAFPSLLFTFAICFSLVSTREEAVFVGVISGLLQDIYFSYGFGLNALTNMIICLIVAHFGRGIFKRRLIVPVSVVFVTTIVKHLAIYCSLMLLDHTGYLYNVIYVAIYNAVIAAITYKFIFKFADSENVSDKWRIR